MSMRSVLISVSVAALATLLAGCATRLPFPEETLRAVDPSITVARLRQEPGGYLNARVMLGGRIVATRPRLGQTEIEVLASSLGDDGRPMDTDLTEGRFLIVTAEFVDPAVYAAERRVTVLGRVSGEDQRQIGDHPYRYPIVMAERLKLWPREADLTRYGYPYHYPYLSLGYFHYFGHRHHFGHGHHFGHRHSIHRFHHRSHRRAH